MRYYTAADVLKCLEARIRKSSQKQVAEELGFFPQYINDVIRGRRDISGQMAQALGFEKLPDRYRRAK